MGKSVNQLFLWPCSIANCQRLPEGTHVPQQKHQTWGSLIFCWIRGVVQGQNVGKAFEERPFTLDTGIAEFWVKIRQNKHEQWWKNLVIYWDMIGISHGDIMWYMEVSQSGGTPKSFVFKGCSIRNTIHFGKPHFRKPPIYHQRSTGAGQRW